MTTRLPYVHEVWFTDTKEPFPGSPIRGKAALKRAMLGYYFDDGGTRRVAMRLVDSPNAMTYVVVPRHNRLGYPDIAYVTAKVADMLDDSAVPMRDGVLPCPVCREPVEKGQWFLLANQAQHRVETGHPLVNIPQRPVHLECLASFDPRLILEEE